MLLAASATILYATPLLGLAEICALIGWFVPRAYRERAELLRIQELNRKLMRRLERTLEQAQSKPSSDTSLAVFKRVGLSENVPLHVFLACRASYRRRHHPDGRPEHEKEAAIKLFQEFEVIFSRIATIRSWSGREGCGRP